MNVLCREGEELKPFYRGEQLHLHGNVFVVNWSFSNIDLEREKTHPSYSKCEYDNGPVNKVNWET